MPDSARQLELLRELSVTLGAERIRFWLRGGWALDFHLGEVTRDHADIDVVTWERHRTRLTEALVRAGFRAEPSPNPTTQLIFTKNGEELSILLVARNGRAIAVRGLERWPFPPHALGSSRRTLGGVTCRVFSAAQLLYERESHHLWSGRDLRPKDVEAMRLLREISSG